MSTIKVLVHEQSLRVIDGPKIASRGVNENYIKFTFDSSWTGFGKVAIFYMEDDESSVYQSIVESDGTALVPWEVTSLDGKMCFGVAGTNNNVVYTSEIIKYNIVKGAPIIGSESEPPSPTIYQQMLTLVGQVQYDVNAIQTDVNTLVSQMDTFIADHAGVYGETLIYDASVTGVYLFGDGQDVEPLNDISIRQDNFDFLDIYYIFGGSGYVFTKDYRNYNTEHIYVHAMSTNVATANITFAQLELAMSGKHIRVTSATRTDWLASTGPTIVNVDDDYVAQDPSDYPAGYIKKIIGRKLVGDAELVDARVGVDGTVYQTVGEAIRSQIDDVVSGAIGLDTTLTQQGKAADAKAVGDGLSQLSADLLQVYVDGTSLIINGGIPNGEDVSY